MKKLSTALALALGLLLPFGAMAISDVDVTIRVMKMHEKSTQEVMNRIELPEAAIDKVTEEANFKKRLIKRVGDTEIQGKHYAGEDPGDGDGSGTAEGAGQMDWDRTQDHSQFMDQDQDRVMDQDQDRAMEMDQDQIRDNEHEFDNEPPMELEMEIEQEQHEIESDHEEPGQDIELPGQPQQGPGSGG